MTYSEATRTAFLEDLAALVCDYYPESQTVWQAYRELLDACQLPMWLPVVEAYETAIEKYLSTAATEHIINCDLPINQLPQLLEDGARASVEPFRQSFEDLAPTRETAAALYAAMFGYLTIYCTTHSVTRPMKQAQEMVEWYSTTHEV